MVECDRGEYVPYAEAMEAMTMMCRAWMQMHRAVYNIEDFEFSRVVFAQVFPGYRLVGDSVETCRVGEVK